MNNNTYIDKITGPVIPIPTPFKENKAVDHESLKNYIKFLSENGIKNIMTTVGTSRYNLLTEEEVKATNKTIAESCDNGMISIVANPIIGDLEKGIEYAKHAENVGANVYLCYFPERYYGDDLIVSYFKKIAASISIPILIHEMPMRNGLGGGSIQYSLSLLEKLFAIDNVIGVKEESLDINYGNSLVKNISDKAVVIGAGGGMSRYLRDYWRGAKAFLGGIGNFYPKLELDFYDAMMQKDFEKAHKIVHEQEIPYFEKVVPKGWHPSLKAAISLTGYIKNEERPPMKAFSEQELKELESILKENNWI